MVVSIVPGVRPTSMSHPPAWASYLDQCYAIGLPAVMEIYESVSSKMVATWYRRLLNNLKVTSPIKELSL